MRLAVILFLLSRAIFPCAAQDLPALELHVEAGPNAALMGVQISCGDRDWPDAPARAIHIADGSVQLYATDRDNRLDTGADLNHLVHRCPVVFRGGGKDDPGAYNDRAWIASPWTADGRTIWAVIHNEFHGHLRPQLCPSRRYMDCWLNALTFAVSDDEGQSFHRSAPDALVAALPYRYDEVGIGHHGYFNPSNIVTLGDAQFMFAFATHANGQREGNCLLRSRAVGEPTSWRGWNGADFSVNFVNPYTEAVPPEAHICTPVDLPHLRWPITSLVRHTESGLFIATMQNTAQGGGVLYATSPDLLHWSAPALLFPAIGLPAWHCGDPSPVAYPSLLDPESSDRNFETVGAHALLFATSFVVDQCRLGAVRELVRWTIRVSRSSRPRGNPS